MKNLSNIILFLVSVSLLSCSKKKEYDATPTPEPPSTALTVNSTAQYSVNIDGTVYANKDDGANLQNMCTSSKSTNSITWQHTASYGSSFENFANSSTYISFERGILHYSGALTPSNTVFWDFFPLGSYSYTDTANYVEIKWYDGSGNEWNTKNGSGDQTGSSFKIEDRKDISAYGDYNVIVLAKFNCKLYNSAGQSKTLTDGQFVGAYGNN